MRKVQVGIYYNEKKGYLIFPFGVLENGPRVIIDPGIIMPMTASPVEIGEAVQECLLISKESLPISKNEFNKNLVLEKSGFKSHSAFNKAYQYVACVETEDKIKLTDNVDQFEISLKDISGEILGNRIVELFASKKMNSDIESLSSLSFETVNGNVVSYLMPSDQFEDKGDGYTDAYQIYEYIENSEVYLAFMIDSGYQSFEEESIREKWEKWHPLLTHFVYEKIEQNDLKFKISAAVGENKITSYFYEDNDNYLEVMTQLTSNCGVAEKEVKRIIDSIQRKK